MKRVDYDEVAPTYEQRYEHREYGGIAAFLDSLTAGAARVLEVGCGTGHWLGLLARSSQVTGLDPSREMLARTPRHGRVAVVQGRAEVLPFTSKSFDAVVAVNALHHFTDKEAFVREAGRVLRPGGHVATLGLDPTTDAGEWFVYDYFPTTLDSDRERYPTGERISGWLSAAGFVDIQTTIADSIQESVDARAYLEAGRLTKHSTSQLALLDDAAFEIGLTRIRRDIENATPEDPASLRADLRIFATQGRGAD